MDINHIHSDLKDLFKMSNATTIHSIMAATVLICNSTTSFTEAGHGISIVVHKTISPFGSAKVFPHFLHFTVSNGSYMEIKTLTLFRIEDKKKRGVLVSCFGRSLFCKLL
jgi:hypothetical protein